MKQTRLLTLERRISAERFAPYLAASAGDRDGALMLYERNLALSAAFWEVLSDVEILIRNALARRTNRVVARYERSLWFPCLRYAFPGLQRRGIRRDVHEAMRSIHLLRNRIAHHEPIHNRPLANLHDQALTTAEWVCPVTRQWIAARSRVPELLAAPLETSPGR